MILKRLKKSLLMQISLAQKPKQRWSIFLAGRASDALIAGLLTALRIKGETVDEVVGFAKAMRRHATPIFPLGQVSKNEVLVDTAGMGGDARGTFNISTAAAFVIAGAGVAVAKHGNRSFSSHCGSADVLEALRENRISRPNAWRARLKRSELVFCSRPRCTQLRAMRCRCDANFACPPCSTSSARSRIRLDIRTIVGVNDPNLTELVARALGELGVRRAYVFHGADGLDEISISGESYISELRDGSVEATR